MASQAGGLFAYRSRGNQPTAALGLIFLIHTIVFVCLMFHFLNVETLVLIANAFFICNSLCGLAAAYKLLSGRIYKKVCLFLMGGFTFASFVFIIVGITVYHACQRIVCCELPPT